MPAKLTAAQWRKSRWPADLIEHLEAAHRVKATKAGRRKLVLFFAAAARRGWDRLAGDPARSVIVALERAADGEIAATTLEKVARAARKDLGYPPSMTEFDYHLRHRGGDPLDGLRAAVVYLTGVGLNDAWQWHTEIAKSLAGGSVAAEDGEYAAQADLLRDLFGNPFVPVKVGKRWRSSAAVGLARSMYESRDFSAIPILADALEEAGCGNPDILAHCRADAPHVRGCWVVDLVLGKA